MKKTCANCYYGGARNRLFCDGCTSRFNEGPSNWRPMEGEHTGEHTESTIKPRAKFIEVHGGENALLVNTDSIMLVVKDRKTTKIILKDDCGAITVTESYEHIKEKLQEE